MNKSAYDKFRVVFDDGTVIEKSRYDIAIFSINFPNSFVDGEKKIEYHGEKMSFIATLIEDKN